MLTTCVSLLLPNTAIRWIYGWAQEAAASHHSLLDPEKSFIATSDARWLCQADSYPGVDIGKLVVCLVCMAFPRFPHAYSLCRRTHSQTHQLSEFALKIRLSVLSA